MTFAELPIASWFVSTRDPNEGPLFKWDDRIAQNEGGMQIPVSADDEVLVVRLPPETVSGDAT